jgi:hypothetical protein
MPGGNMPYQFILGAPLTRHGRTDFEYYSDHADRGDVPNIVHDEARAKRFSTQIEAAQAVPLLMHAREHMHDVIRRSLGRSTDQFIQKQDSPPIHIIPVE